ncbi:MAG: hypothetical protein ACK58T_23000, partial [Phycisphaerae bacterium]
NHVFSRTASLILAFIGSSPALGTSGSDLITAEFCCSRNSRPRFWSGSFFRAAAETAAAASESNRKTRTFDAIRRIRNTSLFRNFVITLTF